MPLYDCMLLLKPHVSRELLMDLVARIGKHVHMRNGVVTNVKSFDKVYLGYGSIDADDYDGYSQHQQGIALLKQGRSAAALASS
ncbi:hypothetical protein IFM89_007659 [Coptis chinensis]|uniref:Uncharacterized protein n=1 Tax=Coptis chinensis TaxID=261450 RepID=A0A835LQP1_9MAGN|nr:hypothetical protein IFM89_007659 [Coptis chinensis]